MAWVSPALTTANIITRAATRLGLEGVNLGTDTATQTRMYVELNDFMQGLARVRNFWFLRRECFFATSEKVGEYTLRTAASATVTISGVVSDADTITINSRVYEFNVTGGAYTGNVEIDMGVTSGTIAADSALDLLVSAINGDASRQCMAVRTGLSTVELYWGGNSGATKAVAKSGTNIAVDATFTASMQDFSRLQAIRWYGNPQLRRVSANQQIDTYATPADGTPFAFDVTADATVRLYSHAGGWPDGAYLIKVGYQALPSAVASDGSGNLDFPIEFQDILPLGLAVLYKAGGWDEDAVFGDSFLSRRIAEMEAFSACQIAYAEREPRAGRRFWVPYDYLTIAP